MTEERFISGIIVTSGEVFDGKEIPNLVEKSKKNGINVNEVIGDTAYSTKDNINYCEEKEITLIVKSNPAVSGAVKPKNNGFEYNKDARMIQCPAGELATREEKRVNRHGNKFPTYNFIKAKCGKCSLANKCKVGMSKTKTHSITIATERSKTRMEFEKSEYFNKRTRIRYRI